MTALMEGVCGRELKTQKNKVVKIKPVSKPATKVNKGCCSSLMSERTWGSVF